MAAYNFQRRFVKPIRAGRKHHTIRAERKDGRVPKVGEALHLYTGMRTRTCERILTEPVKCTRVQPIEINASTSAMVSIDGVLLDYDEREQLAIADGFSSWDEMLAFWDGRLPFKGHIIHWRKA